MTDWEMTALGDLVHIKHGFAFPGSGFGTEAHLPTLVTPGNFAIGGGFVETKRKTFRGEYPNEYLLKPHSIVVTMTDLSKQGDTLGYSARIPSGGHYLHNQRIGLIENLRTDLLHTDFVYFLLQTKPYRQHVLATATGSTVRHTSPKRIGAFRFSLPPLEEQRRIAEVLGALDDLIDTNERLKSDLDELARATFVRAWDGETWTTITELGEVIMGQSPPGDTYSETPVGVPFHQGVRDFGARFPSSRIYCSAPTRIAEAGDILIAVRAPVGEMNVAPERLAIGRGLAALRATRPSTALQAIRAFESTWSAHQGTGTVFSSINGKDLRAAKVPLVEDENVEAALSELDYAYAELECEGADLRRTRDELLPLLMSGGVRVRPDGAAA